MSIQRKNLEHEPREIDSELFFEGWVVDCG